MWFTKSLAARQRRATGRARLGIHHLAEEAEPIARAGRRHRQRGRRVGALPVGNSADAVGDAQRRYGSIMNWLGQVKASTSPRCC